MLQINSVDYIPKILQISAAPIFLKSQISDTSHSLKKSQFSGDAYFVKMLQISRDPYFPKKLELRNTDY